MCSRVVKACLVKSKEGKACRGRLCFYSCTHFYRAHRITELLGLAGTSEDHPLQHSGLGISTTLAPGLPWGCTPTRFGCNNSRSDQPQSCHAAVNILQELGLGTALRACLTYRQLLHAHHQALSILAHMARKAREVRIQSLVHLILE